MYELTKEQRLCKNREYQLVYRRGKSYVNRRVVLYVLPRSPKQPTRIGFVTSTYQPHGAIRAVFLREGKAILASAWTMREARTEFYSGVRWLLADTIVADINPSRSALNSH